MFNNNSFLKVEFLPDGRPVFTTKINKHTKPEHIANFINSFIIRENLHEWMTGIYNICESKGLLSVGEEICERVFNFQNDIEVRPVKRNPRNPLIKPSQVMNQLAHGDRDE